MGRILPFQCFYGPLYPLCRCLQVGVTKWLKQLETVFYSAGISFDKVGTWQLGCSSVEAS